jgi:hypothetical protein
MHPIGHSDPSPIGMDTAPSASVPQVDRTTRKQAILIFCLLMFCYSYVHQRPGWNQNSRLDLLHAIFVHKTLKIDAYHENTGDKSIHNGHYYSDKAPGIVVLALPAFALSAGMLRVFDIDIDSPKGWFISDWITTALSVGLITALGGAAMFLFLCKLVPRPYAFLTTLAVFLGSAPFPYATMLFSHAAVIGLLCIALWAIADDEFVIRHLPGQPKIQNLKSEIETTLNSQHLTLKWRKRHILAGLCCGFAIASEFPAALAGGGVLVLALFTSWRRGLVVTLGAIPPLLLLLAHNWACFGGPLSFGYHHLALTEFQEMNKGLFGINFPPKASAAYLILFSPARGLFFWTPFFAVAFLGLKPLWRASQSIFLVSCFVFVAQVIAISGYYMPSGGAALGPRHLAPAISFLAIPTVIGLLQSPRLGLLLGYGSILCTGIATVIRAMPPENIEQLVHSYLQSVEVGRFAPNFGSSVGVPSFAAILPMVFALSAPFIVVWFRRELGSVSATSCPTARRKKHHPN